MGGLAGESGRGLNTRAYNPKDPGTGSYGIGQWNRERRTALENFAKNSKYGIEDFRTQMDFVKHELQTTEAKTLAKMKAAPDIASATKTWTKAYERPKAGYEHYDTRIAHANHFAGLNLAGAKSPQEAADAAGNPNTRSVTGGNSEFAYTDPQVTTSGRKADPFNSLFGGVDKAITEVSNEFNGKAQDPNRPVNHTVDHLGEIFGVSKKADGATDKADSGFFGETSMAAMVGSFAGGMLGGPIGAIVGGLAGQGISRALDKLADYQQTVADTAVTQGAAGGTGRTMSAFFGGIGNIFSTEAADARDASSGGYAKPGDVGMDKNGFPTRPSGGSSWNGQYSSTDQNGKSWSGQAQSAINDSKSKGGPQGLY